MNTRNRVARAGLADTGDDLVVLFADERETGRWHLLAFALVALGLHGVLFLVDFPDPAPTPAPPAVIRDVPAIRPVYIPPPPLTERRPPVRVERQRAVPVPDPTPEAPEPLVEPEPPLPVPVAPEGVELLGLDPEPPPAIQPLHAGVGDVTYPELIPSTKAEPVYPESARRARLGGLVTLRIVVRRDGTVGDVEVLSENPVRLGFAESAVEAVRRWRYHPARLKDRPVDAYLRVTVRYVLDQPG